MMKKPHGGREKQKAHVDACVGVPERGRKVEEEDSQTSGCVAMATHW